jgi:hypothetical protein
MAIFPPNGNMTEGAAHRGFWSRRHRSRCRNFPSCVVIQSSQSPLTAIDIGKYFVRIWPREKGMNVDFSYIPKGPLSEDDKMLLNNIKPDGTLVFIKSTWERELDPSWNDSYWIGPEEYLKVISQKV